MDIKSEIIKKEEELVALKKQQTEAEEQALKDRYGTLLNCDHCRFSVRLCVGDFHTTCIKRHCIHCRNWCLEYKPMNSIAQYLADRGEKYDTNDMYLCEKLLKLPDDVFEDAKLFYELSIKLWPDEYDD